MAFHYLIDGYNVLYALAEMPSGSWQEKRSHLLAYLNLRRPQGNNAMTVVFDNREGPGGQTQEKGMTVVFTSGETADEWIGAQVRAASNPRALVVVSNDQGIRGLVRGTGAKFIGVSDFLKDGSSPHPPASASPRPAPSNESDITEELKRKWL